MKRITTLLFMLGFTLAHSVYGADDMSKYHIAGPAPTTEDSREFFFDMVRRMVALGRPEAVEFLTTELGLTRPKAQAVIAYAISAPKLESALPRPECDPAMRVSNGREPMEVYDHMREVTATLTLERKTKRQDRLNAVLSRGAVDKIDSWAYENLTSNIQTGEVDLEAAIADGVVDVDMVMDNFCAGEFK